jgi:hypothetical protein
MKNRGIEPLYIDTSYNKTPFPISHLLSGLPQLSMQLGGFAKFELYHYWLNTLFG